MSFAARTGWVCLALAFAGGCGRVGIELITFAEETVCALGVCSNDIDRCPQDDTKTGAGICGCGVPDTADQDGDGTPDCDDMCPSQPDRASNGSCTCDAAKADSDGDGSANCRDLCPHDPGKLAPRICGCGLSELDSDGDGMPDCADECPDDATKVLSGKCGCGVAENARDADGDGKLDCIDLCNGVDDARYVPVESCGIGFCSTNTTPSTCTSGVETDCQPGPPKSTTDATCDGVDDDCDGTADEDFAGASTLGGAGRCVAQGTLTCVNGKPVDSCKPENPAVNDMTCDGVDEDCDGQRDEDFQPRASSCGAGVCAATGTVTCVNGVETDSCRAGLPTGADTDCNGVDEDCDGAPDDGYVGTATVCGSGPCSTTGSFVCIAGVASDSCVPGMVTTPSDPTCNGVDDNCNGTKDENYVPVASSCGVGACRRTGQVNCVGGRTSDTCRPGAPAANDSSCNNVDDDCNGQLDEDYVVPTSNCGVGVCQRSGVINCVGGSLQNTCVPGAPSASNDGPPANGLDDDCDGQIDEDSCVPGPPRVYSAGVYRNIPVPVDCLTANVRLWGGGGGAGGWPSLSSTGTPGRGGSGGYSEGAVAITSSLNLMVGNGGAGCGAGGTNAGAFTYNGGAGSAGTFGSTGTNGQDGSVPGGGAGGTGGSGNGGRGYYGGGGGASGAGSLLPPYSPGAGGGGGAATALLVGTTRALVAGGGGGGGGVSRSFSSTTGGAGGEGCSGAGGVQNAGSGGGGGVCIGNPTQGSNGVPANVGTIPSGRAGGGAGSCGAGGGGYAIITFSR
jgi:hypothetical protein